MCGCFVLSGTIGSCMFFSPWFFLSRVSPEVLSKKTHHTNTMPKTSGWSRSASGIASFPKCLSFRSTCVFFDPKGQTGRHLRPSTPENQIPGAGAGFNWRWCLLYRCTKKGPTKRRFELWHVVEGCFFFGIENTQTPLVKKQEKWENCRAKSWKISRSFGLTWPPFELAKEREIRTDPSWTTFWFFGFYKIPNYLELRLLQWGGDENGMKIVCFCRPCCNPVGWCPRLIEKC